MINPPIITLSPFRTFRRVERFCDWARGVAEAVGVGETEAEAVAVGVGELVGVGLGEPIGIGVGRGFSGSLRLVG